jgi:hypothetical protein
VRLLIVPTLLVACLALGSPQPAVAQAGDPTPSARELREAYPLHATPEAGAGEVEPARTASGARRGRAPAAQSSPTGLRTVVAAVLAILAFAVGFAIAARSPRRARPGSEWSAEPEPKPPPPAAEPSAPRRPTLEPPATGRAWSAEIEWHATAGVGCFRAIARAVDGSDTAFLAKSASVEWPPSGHAAVPTLSTAVEQLEKRFVAAGWRPLAPGGAWYAKRFAWEPVASMPAASGRFARAQRRTHGSTRTAD